MDTFEINASNETLSAQASISAKQYMIEAKEAIDAEFGSGYAKENPELVAAFMRTAAMDFHTMILGRTLNEQLGQVELALKSTSTAISRQF